MRKIDSLRISLTQKCNLKCPYCHKEGQADSEKEISLAEIDKLAVAARNLGIDRVKLTGGEPLLRKDVVEIVSALKKRGFSDISMVTNGVLLEKYARQLKDAGLGRVNIGCDSAEMNFLKNQKDMSAGLAAAKEAGLSPIKLNMIVMKGLNVHEIPKMMDFARENGAILQLIELINFGSAEDNDFYKRHYYSLEEIEVGLQEKAVSIKERHMQNRKQYDLGDLKVEVVRPFHNSFCENCTRVRVTPDGKVKPCLMRNDNLVIFENEDSLRKAIRLKV